MIMLIASKLVLRRREMPSHSPVLVSVSFLFLNPISVSYWPSQGDRAFYSKHRLLLNNAAALLPETRRHINWNSSKWPGSHVLTVKVNFFLCVCVTLSDFWSKSGDIFSSSPRNATLFLLHPRPAFLGFYSECNLPVLLLEAFYFQSR